MAPASLRNPPQSGGDNEQGEHSPLLASADGQDTSMPTRRSLLANNLFGGPRALATQIGCLMLLIPVAIVILKNPAGLFSYHPPLQTFAIILFAQGVLTLQPTSTKADKARGLAIHQIFQITGLAIIAAGVSIMIANKALHSAPHFTSWHGRFGLVTSILLVMQALIGILIAYDPGMRLLGGESKAKALWKYHRLSGYLILPLSLFTAALATTSADWMLGHSTLAQRVLMTAGLALIALGLWSGASLKKLGIKTA
ncbi:hypothetical protein P389DRAFT_78252 [Cystobasidium minutum MCA 4210]|uniref:uncharacterized protein n=1 Tax=Cystobasidium minutum MCA 4210 TaxID=1397322 RepID=UPI0034CF35EE|eukprot:jgi/Rhomi1/78252/CE78251_2397